jgi:hypothetical protein
MLTTENAIERVFCPHCGKSGAYDCTGEDDWVCATHFDHGGCKGFIRPLHERDLQGAELVRLRMENEQLRLALQRALESATKRDAVDPIADNTGKPSTRVTSSNS